MKKLGEQWIEVIDGKKHMLKAVEGPCERCDISHTCNLSADCHMERGLIAKDLGILNKDGCLPAPWGGYPKIIHEVDQNRTENGEDVHYDNLWCVEIHELVLVCTDEHPTKQEAIDAWNRRA